MNGIMNELLALYKLFKSIKVSFGIFGGKEAMLMRS